MPPLNQVERRKAFLNFLIFFSVTITVIVVVIFFSIEVPFVDNRRLRDQVAQFKDQKELTKSLQAELAEVAGLINTLESKDVNQPLIESQIDGRLGTINNLVRTNISDSESVRYYSRLTDDMVKWKNQKKGLSNMRNSEAEIARLNQQIVMLNAQLAQKEQTINNLMQQR